MLLHCVACDFLPLEWWIQVFSQFTSCFGFADDWKAEIDEIVVGGVSHSILCIEIICEKPLSPFFTDLDGNQFFGGFIELLFHLTSLTGVDGLLLLTSLLLGLEWLFGEMLGWIALFGDEPAFLGVFKNIGHLKWVEKLNVAIFVGFDE
jgi:hypothetical protein